MKVNSQSSISFKNLYTNRNLKKGLEFAADYSAIFAASASVAFSAIRPAVIWLTPDTNKENRKIACAKSLASSMTNFGIMLCASAPLSNAIKKIDSNSQLYLNNQSVKFYKNGYEDIHQSKSYVFATQIFKLGLGLIFAVPKAILTATGMPYIIDNVFKQSSKKNVINEPSEISFKGKINERLAGSIGKTLNKKGVQDFSEKYKNSNFVMHIMALTDTISTLTFIRQTKKSEKIKEERKNALVYNAGISTGLCIGSSYVVDKLLDKPTEKFIKKYKELNNRDKNLAKQIEGIKIAKPLLILGSIYYMAIPFLSTWLAERADERKRHQNN